MPRREVLTAVVDDGIDQGERGGPTRALTALKPVRESHEAFAEREGFLLLVDIALVADALGAVSVGRVQ